MLGDDRIRTAYPHMNRNVDRIYEILVDLSLWTVAHLLETNYFDTDIPLAGDTKH